MSTNHDEDGGVLPTNADGEEFEETSQDELQHLAGAGTEDSEGNLEPVEQEEQEEEEYGERVRKQMGKLTKKWRGAEREGARAVAAEAARADALQARLDELEKSHTEDAEETYKTSEERLKTRIKVAAEDEDWAEMTKANEELRELDKGRFNQQLSRQKKAPVSAAPGPRQGPSNIAPEAQQWIDDNDDWFSEDSPDYDPNLAKRAIRWSKKLQKEDLYTTDDPNLYVALNKKLGLSTDDDGEEQEEKPAPRFVNRGHSRSNVGPRGPRRKNTNPNVPTARDKELMAQFMLDPSSAEDQAAWMKHKRG